MKSATCEKKFVMPPHVAAIRSISSMKCICSPSMRSMRLLKTLEEPPPQVVFIFATTEPQKVPVTILSRCQRFDFHKVASTRDRRSALQEIAEQGEHSHQPSERYIGSARRAEGSLRDAQTLFDQVVAFCGFEVLDDDVGHLLGVAGEDQVFQLLKSIMAQASLPRSSNCWPNCSSRDMIRVSCVVTCLNSYETYSC